MDTLTFVSTLAQALAWPAAAIVGLLLLRRPLFGILAALRKLKYGDLEASFGERVDTAADAAVKALPPTAPSEVPTLPQEFVSLAETSPRAAILESWLRVGSAAVAALRRKGIPLGEPKAEYPPAVVETALRDSKLLSQEQIALLQQLRQIRNRAAHSALPPAPGEAMQYAILAFRLIRVLGAGGKAA